MQELASNIFIETAYAGVTLGAINWSHGLILIDAPFRAEDTRAWRASLLSLGGGIDRLLINLDAHFDRTLGVRAMECTVIGHENMAEVFRNRPVTFKTGGAETGAEWEQYNNLGSIRWVPPEITFTRRLVIHWDGHPLILEEHAGQSIGAIWAQLPDQEIVFVGDAVTPGQPPFLSSASLPAWIENLRLLTTPEYQNYLIVSGRGGLVAQAQLRQQLQQLERLHLQIDELAAQKAPVNEVTQLAQGILTELEQTGARYTQYQQRLQYGLQQYYLRHYHPGELEISE